MNNKLWGGRFTTQTSREVEDFLASIHFDKELAQEDILGSLAHAKMLGQCQIISAAEAQMLQQGLKKIAATIRLGTAVFSSADEDIHMNIERMLGELIGPVAGKLHTGRSRNDQVALDLHLYLRTQTVILFELLNQLQHCLIEQAERYKTVILPGYTHLQRAQPIRLGHWFLAYAAMLDRDAARIKDAWPRLNQSPLGAAALAGTPYAIDPQLVADSLGFTTVYSNSLDAVSDRDFVIEFLSNAALIMMHLSKLSEELILWSSQEFDFIRLQDGYCTGSSIMPQKKNPDVPELVRGKTGRVYGSLLSVLTLLKGLPLAYNKDLQEDKEPLFDTVKTLQSVLQIYTPLLKTLTVNANKMQLAVHDGFLNATDLADYLTGFGLSFRQAHHVAGKMVAYCVEKSCRLEEMPLATMQQFCAQIDENVYAILQAEQIIEARRGKNASSLAALTEQISKLRDNVLSDRQWIAHQQQLIESVYNL